MLDSVGFFQFGAPQASSNKLRTKSWKSNIKEICSHSFQMDHDKKTKTNKKQTSKQTATIKKKPYRKNFSFCLNICRLLKEDYHACARFLFIWYLKFLLAYPKKTLNNKMKWELNGSRINSSEIQKCILIYTKLRILVFFRIYFGSSVRFYIFKSISIFSSLRTASVSALMHF